MTLALCTKGAGGGYRLPLFRLANKSMKSITFVGANASGPATVDGLPFPRANSGYSGYIIDTVAGRQGISQFFPAQIVKYKPNIILLMIGTNDVDTGETDIPTRLANLMDSMLNADPKLLLVVAQIVPQQQAVPDTLNVNVRAFNAAIPALVKSPGPTAGWRHSRTQSAAQTLPRPRKPSTTAEYCQPAFP